VKRLALLLVPLLFAGAAVAETGFQFAVPNFNAPSDPNVRGLRFSFLHGKNRSMRGVDFGLLSMSETSRASGVAFVACVHKVSEEMSNERRSALSCSRKTLLRAASVPPF
jgi:hypothetical protein